MPAVSRDEARYDRTEDRGARAECADADSYHQSPAVWKPFGDHRNWGDVSKSGAHSHYQAKRDVHFRKGGASAGQQKTQTEKDAADERDKPGSFFVLQPSTDQE